MSIGRQATTLSSRASPIEKQFVSGTNGAGLLASRQSRSPSQISPVAFERTTSFAAALQMASYSGGAAPVLHRTSVWLTPFVISSGWKVIFEWCEVKFGLVLVHREDREERVFFTTGDTEGTELQCDLPMPELQNLLFVCFFFILFFVFLFSFSFLFCFLAAMMADWTSLRALRVLRGEKQPFFVFFASSR